ncbi:MAG: c-type cytochrome, partial [Bacteroidia bacterium]
AANIVKGAKIYKIKCQSCHGINGEGKLTPDNVSYLYPPLWGKNSYAQGSSMHRLISASRFVKWSMPYVEHITKPQLTDEEVYDVVAFVNCDSIHPRPYRNLEKDCPDLPNKPIDFPSGPYLDTFPVSQHILGPYKPIKEFYDNLFKANPKLAK